MTTLKVECRLFSANIFNPSKCQNCFRTKESHLAEAFENKRARRIAKCGYLFVAPPDWDFSLSINRTKRWQRRYFILAEDGKLSYALDENPDTVPQATIDMNTAEEVTDAEEETGNAFAIAIRCPTGVHFVKGTSAKEKQWWFEVLSRFPKLGARPVKTRRAPAAKIVSANNQHHNLNNNNIHVNDNESKVRSKSNKPVLCPIWLCFTANLPSLGSSNKQQRTEDIVDAEMSQRRNWINSNLNGPPPTVVANQKADESLQKLAKLQAELKGLHKELNESHENYDYLEMAHGKLKKEMSKTEELHEAEMHLMKHRINDLTGKLTLSERSLRETKHKLAKHEERQARRRHNSSLKERYRAEFENASPSACHSLASLDGLRSSPLSKRYYSPLNSTPLRASQSVSSLLAQRLYASPSVSSHRSRERIQPSAHQTKDAGHRSLLSRDSSLSPGRSSTTSSASSAFSSSPRDKSVRYENYEELVAASLPPFGRSVSHFVSRPVPSTGQPATPSSAVPIYRTSELKYTRCAGSNVIKQGLLRSPSCPGLTSPKVPSVSLANNIES